MKRSTGYWLLLGVFVWGCSSDEESAESNHSGHDAGPDATTDAGPDGAGGTAGAAGSGGTPFDGPEKLSETGLYSDIGAKKIAADVFPFDVRFPTWVDGLTSNRYLLLPAGTKIDTSQMDFWKFPIGTKAWKDFSKDGKLIETRYLEKRADGDWLEIAYAWDAAATEALPVPDGVTASGTAHDVPSQDGCTQCHNGEPERLLGVSAVQLSREVGTGPLTELVNKGLLTSPPTKEFPVPGDGVVEGALGYLHANCGHCHNDTHFLAPIRLIRYRLTVTATTPEETPTYKTNLNQSKMNHVMGDAIYSIVPGKPGESQTWVRTATREIDMMPPLDTKMVDPVGIKTLADWITALPP